MLESIPGWVRQPLQANPAVRGPALTSMVYAAVARESVAPARTRRPGAEASGDPTEAAVISFGGSGPTQAEGGGRWAGGGGYLSPWPTWIRIWRAWLRHSKPSVWSRWRDTAKRAKGGGGTVEDGELVCSGLKISGVSACIIGVAYAARTPRQGHMNTAIDTTRRKGHYGGCKG